MARAKKNDNNEKTDDEKTLAQIQNINPDKKILIRKKAQG